MNINIGDKVVSLRLIKAKDPVYKDISVGEMLIVREVRRGGRNPITVSRPYATGCEYKVSRKNIRSMGRIVAQSEKIFIEVVEIDSVSRIYLWLPKELSEKSSFECMSIEGAKMVAEGKSTKTLQWK